MKTDGLDITDTFVSQRNRLRIEARRADSPISWLSTMRSLRASRQLGKRVSVAVTVRLLATPVACVFPVAPMNTAAIAQRHKLGVVLHVIFVYPPSIDR
jgi:hypothetical protein